MQAMTEPPPDLAARMGRDLALKRIRSEHSLWHREKTESLKSAVIRNLVHIGLRSTGLWARAHREFLDIRMVENVAVLPSLPREFDGFRLMQITDLHSDIDEALIPRVIELMDGISFDQCVLTGDYHDRIGNDWQNSLALTLDLVPHLGPQPIAILGNHDRLAKVAPLENAGVRMLLNEHVPIERNGSRIWICGVDDAHTFGTHDLRAASAGIPADECRILLSHTPETWREAATHGYALHLSGHTHGGQLCLPGGFAIVTKAAVPRRLLAGPWREGAMLGYTSRGTGSCSVPARLNCPPEITIHILRCA
jgi:predicted MPP superfamily phosphohydrolase